MSNKPASILNSYALLIEGTGNADECSFEVYLTARSLEHAEEIVDNMKTKLLLHSVFTTVKLTLTGDTLESQYPEEIILPIKH